jgi:hypothetical protein
LYQAFGFLAEHQTTFSRKPRNENPTVSPAVSLLHSTVLRDPQDTFPTLLRRANNNKPKTSSDESSDDEGDEDYAEVGNKKDSSMIKRTKKPTAASKKAVTMVIKQNGVSNVDEGPEGAEEAERTAGNGKASNKKKRGVEVKSSKGEHKKEAKVKGGNEKLPVVKP